MVALVYSPTCEQGVSNLRPRRAAIDDSSSPRRWTGYRCLDPWNAYGWEQDAKATMLIMNVVVYTEGNCPLRSLRAPTDLVDSFRL